MESWVAWLNSPMISAFLLIMGMAALVPAMMTLGTGIAESVSIVCFTLFFGARFLQAGHDWIPPVLFVVGVTLLAFEVLVVPGMGKPGFLGVMAIGAAVYLSFPTVEAAAMAVLASGVSATFGGVIAIKFLPKNRMFRKMVVLEPPKADDGPVEAAPAEAAPLLGKQGVSTTPLRPGGFVEIDGQKVDVVADGDFIERGRSVCVVKVEGSRVVVRATSPDR